MTTSLLNKPRRRALEVMAATHPRPGRVSNATTTAGGTALVYWQLADWLLDEGLASTTDHAGHLVLTAAGVIACRAAGIEVRS